MHDDEIRAHIANRLKQARQYVGLSQQEAGDAVQLNRTAIVQIEKGERRVEALELKRFSTTYQRPIEYFTGDPTAENALGGSSLRALARMAQGLEAEDLEELERFAEFLRDKAKAKNKG